MAKGDWTKVRDELGFVHLLDTGVDGYVIKVEKSGGGDYLITAFHEDESAGGDVEYKETLAAAKKYAREQLDDGTWVELTMDPEAAIDAARGD